MKTLFICGHRKSGTSLLTNLLNGHSSLNVYPEDLCLLYGYFPYHIRLLSNDSEKIERIRAVVFDMLRKKSSKRGYESLFNIDGYENNFLKNIDRVNLSQLSSVLPALLTAYENVSKKMTHTHLCIKETGVEIYAKELAEIYPDSKFIHLIRDPRDNYASIKSGVKNYYSKLGQNELDSLMSVIHRLQIGYDFAWENQSYLGQKNYMVLKFEDLVIEPQKILSSICDFLEINYDSVIEQPSILGVDQPGNSHQGLKMFSVSSQNVGQWGKRIISEEQKVIEFFLYEQMLKHHYKPDYSKQEMTTAVSEFYKWSNYEYFYKDSF